MNEKAKTFGKIILEARRKKGLNLKECAALVIKDDGKTISLQYLSDLEKDHRNPPSETVLRSLSKVLDIPLVVLYYHSDKLPPGLDKRVSNDTIVEAFQTFSERLHQKLPA